MSEDHRIAMKVNRFLTENGLTVFYSEETLEEMVVYQAMYGERGVWVRPKSMFDEMIERDGKTLVDYFGSYALVEITLLLLVILPTVAVYIFTKE